MGLKRNYWVLLIFLLAGLSSIDTMAQCTSSPNAVAGFLPNATCQPVTVTLSSVSHIPAFGGVNNIPSGTNYFVDWGDGTTQTYTTIVNDEGVPAFMQTHTYGPADTDCAYTLRFEVSNPCGADFISGTVNVHDTDDMGLAITQDYTICEGYGDTFIFTDATTMNCLAPPFGNPNNEDRTIRWDYGTGGSTLPGVTAGGFDASSAIHNGAAYTVGGPGSNSLAVVIPAASTVGRDGEYFEVTMYNWNSCNRYDDPGIGGPPADLLNGDNPPVSITARITVIESPPAPAAPDRDYCFGAVGPLTASAGFGGTLRWYENATLNAQGVITSGTQVATGATFGHGQTATGTYTYWVTETLPLTNCEGPATEVTLNIREDLNITDAISGSANVCPGETSLVYSLPNPPPAQPVGGATEYIWSVPGGWSITGGQGTESITVTSSGTAGSGNISVVWRFTSAPDCTSPAQTLPVTVNVLPAGNISGNSTICEGNAPNLTINLTQGVGNSGPFEVDYTDGTNTFTETLAFGSNTVTPGIDPPAGGTTTYTITEIRDLATNGCSVTAPHANITGSASVVVRTDLVLTDVISGPTEVCPGDMVSFSLPNPPPTVDGVATIYQWQLPNTSGSNLGTITSGNNTETINVTVGNNTGNKRVRVRWRYANNPRCSTPWQTYNVTVNIQPEAEISGNQTICLGDNPVLTFSNLVGVGGSGPFDIDYSPDGGTTIFTASSVPISGGTVNAPAPGAAGNYTYTIQEIRDLGANGCVTTAPSANISGSANVIVRETLNLTDPVNGPSNVCANETGVVFDLPAAPPSQPIGGATEYQWTVPAGWTITGGQGTESITVDIGSSTGPGRVVSVVWQYPGSPNCTSNSQSTTITVDPGPTVATVGPNLDYCTTVTLVSTVGLGGNSPIVGTGLWTQVSGPTVANITNPNDPNTTVSIASVADAGVYVFRWSITSGTCPASTADVTVDFGTAPQVPDAYTPGNPNEDATCGLTIGLQGSTPLNTLGGPANGQWTQIAGPGTTTFDDDADPTTNATADTYGTYTYQWEVTSGTCTPASSTVQIEYFQSAVVTMPTDFDQCINSNDLGTAAANITSQGTVSGSVSTGTWSVAGGSGAGTGTITTNDLGGGTMELVYEPVLGDLNETLVFQLASANPGTSCTVVTDQFTVTINREPNITNPTAVSGDIEQVICSGGTATLTLTSDTPGTAYNWTASVTSAGTVTGFSTSNAGDISEILLNPGNNVEEVTYVITPSVNGCTGPSVNFVVTIDPTPSAQPDKTTETICDGGTTSIDLDAVMPVAGTTYTWTVTSNPNVTGESGDASGALTDIIQTLNNTSNTAQTVTYTITPTANGNTVCTGPTTDVVVTIQPDPTFTNPGTEDICSGDQLNFMPTGTVAGTNFNWTTSGAGPNITGHSASGSGLISDILTNSGTAPETITYDITPVANGCSGTAGTYVVTVNPKPEITNLPVGSQAICSGANFSFTPTSNITVGTTTYSWTVSSSGNITGLPGSGSGTGNISHTLTNTGTSVETVTYIITATANGCNSDLSPVTVLVSPVADVSNGVLSQTICDGGTLNFTPTSNVVGATFDWTASVTAGTVTGLSASGTGDITDQLFNNTNTSGQVTYVITPSINGCNGIPQNYVVTVDPSPEVTNPAVDLTGQICSNNPVVINPISDVGGATFSWTAVASSGNIIGFSPVGTGPINETVKNNGTTAETITYTVTANASGCSGTPVDFIITVNPEPDISNPATDLSQTLCSGGTATFTPLETVTGTTFNWTVSVTSGTATSADITAGSGTGAINDIITNTGNVDAVVTYVYTPAANGCNGPTFSYVATISPVADVSNLPTTDVICSAQALSFIPTSSVAGATFTWTSVDNPNVSGESATGSGDITDVLTNNSFVQQTVTYTVTPIINGCSGPSQTYTVNIEPKPDVSNSPLSEDICSGDVFNIGLTGNVTGTTFTWSSTAGPNITGNTASGSTDVINDNLVNGGNATETVIYTITPTANGCNGDPVNYTVTVYPTPNISNPVSDLTDEICSGSTTSFNPTGDVAGTVFNWTVAAPVTITSGNADFTAGLGTGAINHDLVNSGSNIETVTYTYTPTANGCNGPTQTYTVTVNPTPDIDNNPGNQTICSTDNFSYTPTGTVTGTLFSWTSSSSSPNLVGNTTAGTGPISDNLVNNGVTQETITYQIVPSANGCIGATETIQIAVNPRPTVSPSVFSQAICDGDATNITLSGNVSFGTGTVFNWTIQNPGPNITGAVAGTGNTIAQTLANSGTATETVTYRITPTANGCNGNTLDIVVTVYPTPVTSAITAVTGSNNGCVDGTNFYRVDGVAGTPGSSYTWSIAPLNGDEPTITSFNNNAVLDFGPNPWTGTLTVIETTNGCDGPPVNLAVEAFSTPTIDAGADQEICQGATIALGGAPTASGGSGIFDYQWTPASGLDNPFAANPNATPSSTIVYTLEVTDASTGCISTDQVRVDIVLPPTQPFISVPSGSPFVCEGDNVTLQSSSIGANSYQWYKDGLPIAGETNQTLALTGVTTTDAGNYQVITIGTNPIGSPCQSPLSLAQTVEVNEVPAKPTITVMGVLPFCDNGANLAILEASADPLANSYEWYFDDGSGFTLIGGQNTNQLIVSSHTQSGNYYVRAIGVGNSFCAGPDSDPETVLIHEAPDVPVWTGPTFACSDNLTSLQVNFTTGTAPYTIEFQDDIGNNFGPFTVNSGDNVSITPTNSGAFPLIRTYSLTSVTDANGCSPPNFGTPFQLEVRPLPIASAITGKTNVCVNETNVIYQVTPSAGSQYVWNTVLLAGVTVVNGGGFGDSFIELNFGGSQILGGILQVSEINNGCPGLPSQLTINVFEPAVADAGSDQTICVGQSVTIGGAPTADLGSGNYNITWAPNLSISNINDPNPTVSPNTTTDYTVTVQDNLSGCAVATSTVRVNVNPLPVITFNPIPGICSSGSPYTLTEASPAGGVYTGPGVSETAPGSGVYEFDPSAVASNSLYTITYTYTDGNGCTNFNTASIEVYDNPTITLNPFADVCIDAPVFTVGGGFANGVDITTLPPGATYAYTGPGVTENPPGSGNFEFDPAAAGSGTHTITLSFSDANGCPALTNATATITVNPLPVVTMDPLPNKGICEIPYTLTEGRVGGTPVAGGRYYEINGIYVTEPTPGTFVFDPNAAGVGTHDIIYEYQDPGTGCINSVTAQIIVEDLPVISLAPFANVGICTAPFTLTGGLPLDQNRTALENGIYSGPGVTETAPGSGIYEFNPANAGVGIHLIRYDYTDQYGCTTFGEVQTITVEPLPFAVFAPIENICVDAAPVELTTGQPAGGTYSGPGVSETFAGSGVYEFDPNTAGIGTHILDYELSDGFGCSTVEQQTITVTDLPSGTVTATGAFCNGGPLQFELTGIAPFSLVYEDDKGNSFNAVNVGNIYVQSVDPTENTTYTLVSVTDRYGCTQSSLPPSTATITITPVASFDVDPPLQILPGKTVTITNNTNPGNWTYTWEFGDGNTLSGTSGAVDVVHPDGSVTTGTVENPVHTYAAYGNYLLELIVTDGNCVGEATAIATIEPLPPVVDFEIDVVSGCAPVTVTFNNLTEFADEDSYIWQFGEGEGFSNAQNPTYIYNNPGVYTVTLTAFNELGIAVTETREMAIEVFEQPQARFSVRPTTIYLPDKPVFCTNLSFGGDSYLWDFGDGNTSTEFEPIHIYEKPGIYDVSLTVFNGDECSDVHTIEEAVVALNGGEIKVPTVFTPDTGGPNGGNVSRGTVENNVFIPLIEGAIEFRMEVYSRWGELMFASNSQTIGWDGYYKGKLAKQGVYLYKVTATFRDGEKITRVGDVTLLR